MQPLDFGSIFVGDRPGRMYLQPRRYSVARTSGSIYIKKPYEYHTGIISISGPKHRMINMRIAETHTHLKSHRDKIRLRPKLKIRSCHLNRRGKSEDIFVGGTLFINRNQSSGTYNGEFTILVEYQ